MNSLSPKPLSTLDLIKLAVRDPLGLKMADASLAPIIARYEERERDLVEVLELLLEARWHGERAMNSVADKAYTILDRVRAEHSKAEEGRE